MAVGAGGILGTPFLKSGGFFGFDPTPNASLVGTARNMANGNFTVAPDKNYSVPKVLGVSTNDGASTTRDNVDTSLKLGNSNYTGDTGGSNDADLQNTLYGIDSGLSQANDGLGRLDNQQNVGMGNIDRDYQEAVNRLMGKQQLDERNYNQNKNDQVNSYLSARNQSSNSARGWLENAQRILGANGAGGGSAARYGVPLEAQTMAASGNSQAQTVNNRNLRALEQSWGDEQNQIKNSRSDLDRQKEQGANDLRSKIAQQRATLLSTIQTLTGQKAIANGGDWQTAQAAAAPFSGQIKGLLDNIDGLAATPAIREQAVQTTAPTLDQYNFARPDAPVVAQQDPTLSNPILAGLFGYDPNKQNQPQYA